MSFSLVCGGVTLIMKQVTTVELDTLLATYPPRPESVIAVSNLFNIIAISSFLLILICVIFTAFTLFSFSDISAF